MYQNTISSPYPIVNPVQMQAPVTVNMPAAAPVSVAQSPAPMQPPMMPMQKAPMKPSNFVADDFNLYNNTDILLRVKKEGDAFHVSSARPLIMDGDTYYIKQDGTLQVHNGWTGIKTLVENCPIMADIYSKLAFSTKITEDSLARARQAGMIN